MENKFDKASWGIVLIAALYLAFSTGRVAVTVWEMWFLTAVLAFFAVAAFANLIRKGTK